MALPPRDKLTFSQAQGLEPLPAPLALGRAGVTQPLRNAIYSVLYESVSHGTRHGRIEGAWDTVLYDAHVHFWHLPPDEFSNVFQTVNADLKQICLNGPYTTLFDWLTFIINHSETPYDTPRSLNAAFERYRAAYRVNDTNDIVPYATEEEGQAVSAALKALSTDQFRGAKTHLRAAGRFLGHPGHNADCVRESINAVEAVCRVLSDDPKATLDEALKRLSAKVDLHGAFRKALGTLYGYASDEGGVRHSLLQEGDAKVDDVDAQFMLGACAAFVSYLIGKARIAGIPEE